MAAKVPQLPDTLDPATLVSGMVPVYDTTTQRWVPGVPTAVEQINAVLTDEGAPWASN